MSDKIDYFALLIGPPGHGKSSLAAELAEARLRAGRWVIAQDTSREFGRFCAQYPSTAAFLELVSRAGREDRPSPLGAAFATSADEVLRLAVQLGEQWNRAHGSTREPVCLVVNEATSFEGSGATWVGQELARAINQRRHLGLELILCLQQPAQLPGWVYEVATEVHMFRQGRSERIVQLERLLNLRERTLDGLGDAPPHRYATARPLVGLV